MEDISLSREHVSQVFQKMRQREMAVFDALPKCVRDVINKSPIGIKPSSIFSSANNVRLLAEDPEKFAYQLEAWLQHESRRISHAY